VLVVECNELNVVDRGQEREARWKWDPQLPNRVVMGK
jgi:hypothetical protein